MRALELSGQRFGLWSVLDRAASPKGANSHWRVKCDCGIESVVNGGSLRRGNSKSCGCSIGRTPRIDGAGGQKHGHSGGRTYTSWIAMKQRCENPNSDRYYLYGARGIKVCSRWMEFQNFLDDMGIAPEGCTIERKDGDGDYEPSNCVWADAETQANNRRGQKKYLVDGQWRSWAQLIRLWGVRKTEAFNRAQFYPTKIIGESNE